MPHLASLGTYLADSAFFFTLDAFKGFWQIPITGDIDSQSMSTPLGIFTSTRLPQGNLNSVFIFQRAMDSILRPHVLLTELLIWLDDLLGHAPSESALLDILRRVFVLCRNFGLKLNASRCRFFSIETKWCGKIYFKGGWKHDPARTLALRQMTRPRTAADLMQFLCACTWLSMHIPDFARIAQPLRELLEELLRQCKNRSKSSARRVPSSEFLWTEQVHSGFSQMLTALEHTVSLSHPNADMERCVFHDSSGDFCSVIITQVFVSDLSKPLSEQRHEPLAFHSKAFSGASLRWSFPEKEAYGLIDAVDRFDYLLICDRPFHIFTDHRNLIFIFNPESSSVPLKRHSIDKIHRWSLRLSSLNYLIEHIPGHLNIWADMLTRWAAPRCTDIAVVRLTKLPVGIVQPLISPRFCFSHT